MTSASMGLTILTNIIIVVLNTFGMAWIEKSYISWEHLHSTNYSSKTQISWHIMSRIGQSVADKMYLLDVGHSVRIKLLSNICS